MSRLTQRMNVAAKAVVGIFSDASMKQAFGLLSGVLPGGMGVPPTRGTQDYLRAYSQMPWLRAVSTRISTAVARTDWQLFVVKGKGEPKARRGGIVTRIQRADYITRRRLMKAVAQEDELQEILEHPFLTMLSEANEFQTGLAMRKVTQIHLDLVGDAFWLKERDALGTVVAVWPIPPHWIMATPTPAYPFFRVNFKAWRGSIPDTEFVWFSDTDPLNPYARGTGIAQALGDELETDEYAARHTKAFFYNSARPDLIISPKGAGAMNSANVDRFEEEWMSRSQGFFRAFKPFFLSREVEVKELQQNFRNTQLIPLRQHERDTILQVFGVPPEILGVLEHSNRATIDAADYLMAKYVIEPRLEFLRAVMQERLIPEYDERLILNYQSPVQDDRGQQLLAAKSAPWSLNINEWRKLTGHNALDEGEAGDRHMVPGTLAPKSLDEIANPPPPPAPVLAPGRPKPAAPRMALPAPRAMAVGELGISEDVTAAVDAGDVPLAEQLQKAISINMDELPLPSMIAARMETGLARALVAAWSAHASGVDVAALVVALGPGGIEGDIVRLIAADALAIAQTAALKQTLEQAVLRGADVGARALRQAGVAVHGSIMVRAEGIAVDLAAVNPEAARFAQEHSAALVQAPMEVRQWIRALIARAQVEGLTPIVVARLLTDVIGLLDRQVAAVVAFHERLMQQGVEAEVATARVARYAQAQRRARALTIARTELISAVNAGQQALWTQAIQVGAIRATQFQKVWIVTPDERLELECESLEGAQVGIEEPFGPGVYYPPLHPNCRCTVGLVPVPIAQRG